MTWLHLAHAALHTLRISVPTLAEAAIGKNDLQAQDERLFSWAKRVVEFARIQLEVTYQAPVPAAEAFVVMSNHQSLYDIPVIYTALQRRLRMVAKKELFAIPVWGQAMRRAGMVELDRGNHSAAMASLDSARTAIANGISIWIAPEGTRGVAGKLGKFKRGGFRLAIDAGARILPVSIDGTWRVLSTQSRVVNPDQRIRVTVHPPLATQGYGEAELGELVQRVQDTIQSGLTTDDSSAGAPPIDARRQSE